MNNSLLNLNTYGYNMFSQILSGISNIGKDIRINIEDQFQFKEINGAIKREEKHKIFLVHPCTFSNEIDICGLYSTCVIVLFHLLLAYINLYIIEPIFSVFIKAFRRTVFYRITKEL